ncbi:PorV/PorQ family protein [candidate division KSB1 bacterium]|nr:PorV/PorQ family protein [candidate division KSB1 bacterium]
MKKRLSLSITLFFLLSMAASVLAEKWTISKNGTAAMPFLKIGVGARAVAMGEAFAAVANDATALFWNPAGIAQIKRYQFHFSHNDWIADLKHDYLAGSMPFGRGAIGIHLISLNTDLIEITTLEEPNGTGLYYDFSDVSLGATYSLYIIDRFAVGITGKYLREKNYNETASVFALDVGTLLHTGFHGLNIGMCFSNIGTDFRYQGTDLGVPYSPTLGAEEGPSNALEVEARLETKDFHLPTNFRVGFAVDLLGSTDAFFATPYTRMTFLTDANYPNDGDQKINVGTEVALKEMVFLRGGYRFNYSHEIFTVGGGLCLNAYMGTLKVDYAYADFGDLSEVHRFSIELGF